MQYPMVQQDGYCASIAVERGHGGRWKAFVTLERDAHFARLGTHPAPIPVPNSYPSDSAAALAAYALARTLIAREQGVATH